MNETKHAFECPACGEQGEITLPDEMMRFDCPADCGASFLKYPDPPGWLIRCVVRPYFQEKETPHG